MAIQDSINRMLGSAAVAATLSGKIASSSEPKAKIPVSGGKDQKIAAKARKEAKQKIKTIMENKEISEKARSRRIGKLLDEYKGGK